ncbi:MAG: metalloregulator ArsR/SmtB family transcription factor [Candidatus Sumerlaeaceae bacterium]|nr:metalloregulator ArsR/SmtB family transcription factor [Candidatus Sumerlaeaceae bacterium]
MRDLFKCLADPTRLRVLHLLAHRGPEICVCDLVAVLQQPQGTISRHLMQLRHLGMVRDRRQNTWMHYSLAEPSTKLHGALLDCLRTACDEEPQLAADLVHFDKLREQKSLACCAIPAVTVYLQTSVAEAPH